MTHPVISDMSALRHLLATKRHYDKRSQTELAGEIGVSQSTLATWENGRRVPPGDQLIAWCKAAGFDLVLGRRTQTPEQGKPV